MGHIDEETGLVKISWSKVRYSEECPQKMHLIANGMRSQVSDVKVFYKGNVVDQAMRRWLSMEHPPPGWMTEQVDAIFDSLEEEIRQDREGVVRWKDPDERQRARLECREAVYRLEYLLRDKALPYDWQPAFRFKAPVTLPGLDGEPRQVLLVGEMDLLTSEAAKLAGTGSSLQKFRVWDLKMTRDADYWRKTVAQLVFYDIVCFCLFGQPTAEVGLLQPMVDSMPWFSFVPSDEDRTEMLTRIVAVAHRVWGEQFAPKEDNAGCSWCECKAACAKFAPRPGTRTLNLF